MICADGGQFFLHVLRSNELHIAYNFVPLVQLVESYSGLSKQQLALMMAAMVVQQAKRAESEGKRADEASKRADQAAKRVPVSYTHLTLPTKRIV